MPISTNAPFNDFGHSMVLRDIEQLWMSLGDLQGARAGDLNPGGGSGVSQDLPDNALGSPGNTGAFQITDELGGDLSGFLPDPIVVGLRGIPLSATTPILGQHLAYNGTSWVPSYPIFGNGGNARGAGAVDWQQARSASTSVASGIKSVISGGEDNKASGDYSTVAGGLGNTASGVYALAAGHLNVASSTGAIAMGDSNSVSDADSVAIGTQNSLSGSSSAAIGYSNSSTHGGTYFFGAGNASMGSNSFLCGKNNSFNGFCFGYGNTGSNPGSSIAALLLGYQNTGNGSGVLVGVENTDNIFSSSNAVLIGQSNANTDGGSAQYQYCLGGSSTFGGDANWATMLGYSNNVDGQASIAIGYSNTVTGTALAGGIAIGSSNSVVGGTNIAVGYNLSITGVSGCMVLGTGVTPTFNNELTLGFTGGVRTNGDFYRSGVKILGLQGSSVTAPSGGGTVDSQARTAINDIISRLVAHGLIA